MSNELGIPVLPVYTTRSCRPDDKHNVHVSVEELNVIPEDEMEKRSYMHVEGEVVYATMKSDAFADKSYVAVGPSEMYVNFLKLFSDRKVFPIVLDVSFDNRLKRMHGRNYEESVRRVTADDREWLDVFDGAHVVNGNRQYWAVVHEVVRIIQQDMAE